MIKLWQYTSATMLSPVVQSFIKMKKNLLIIAFVITGLWGINTYAATSFEYQIIGIQDPLLANVQARLKEELPNPKNLTVKQIQDWNRQAPDEIRQAIEPFGYFKPNIKTQFFYQGDHWQAVYQIEPGPQLHITKVDASIIGEGANNPKLQKLLMDLPIKEGQPFSSTAYEQTKQRLFNGASELGYLDSQLIKHTIAVDRKHYTVVITLQLDTGPRYYFGPVTFQQKKFSEKFLRRYMKFSTGQPYSTAQLLKLQDALNTSGYFQQVWVNASSPLDESHQLPVNVKLVPRPAQQYTVGLGYGTDTGLRGLLGWEWRYINQWGHKLSAVVQLSQIQNGMQVVYSIPGERPQTDQYNITVAALKNNFPQVSSFTNLLGVSAINNRKYWQRTIFLNYQLEFFNYNGQPTQTTHLLTPGITWSHTRYDNVTFAHNGYRVSFRLQGAAQYILSDNTFIQGEAQGKYIHGVGEDGRIILRGDFGYTALSNGSKFAPSLLFYAGGTQSVRGYNYQSMGPGKNLIVASAEYQHRIVGNFYGAAFFDTGNAFNGTPISLQQGAGLGIVWVSPVGPMELTFARALSASKPTYQLQFTMGPDFI